MYPKKQKFRKFNKLYTSQQRIPRRSRSSGSSTVPEPATDSSEDYPRRKFWKL
jgi:hypothetical protein